MAQDDLSLLKDIHLPPPISAWPPAPGWIILATLLLIGSVITVYIYWRRYQYNRPKREAKLLLNDYIQTFLEEGNLGKTCAHTNALLKRVCLAYYPREQIANTYGVEWIEFLNRTTKKVSFNSVEEYLIRYPYQGGLSISKETRQTMIKPLIDVVEKWLGSEWKLPDIASSGDKICSN